jgi:GNAT superfamily N-acetyltransferase
VTSGRYRPPRLLAAADVIDGFRCNSIEQSAWLREHARSAHGVGTTRVFVVTTVGSHEVVGYYAWCMASLRVDDAPTRARKGAGRYPQPIALLARLGVSVDHAGRGLGAGLLADVIARTAHIGDDIGCRGLLVHAESDEARAFYEHLLPEFERSPTDPLHLVLLMKDIRRSLRATGP